ncbi:MAG: lipopolysaccharide biosynthesis protein [Methylobacteriaceae bacterium]|nr:lipopolysaccharide biosynthesis protein [Methylobacteriaceae bacterium]
MNRNWPGWAFDRARAALTSSIAIGGTRIAGAGLGFLSQVLLAHLLGPADLGVFYAATSLAQVAGFAASQGYSHLAVRFSVRYGEKNRPGLFAAFVARAAHDGFVASVAAACAIGFLAFAAPGLDLATRLSYAAAGVAVLATSSLTLLTNLAGAQRSFGWCYLPEGLFRPILFLIAVGALALLVDHPRSAHATIIYVALTCAIGVTVAVALRPLLPRMRRPRPSERRLGRAWRREARPLVILALMQNSFADIAILFATPFLASQDLAIFGLCLKLSLLIGYMVQVSQQMALPDLAEARARRDPELGRRALLRACRWPTLSTAAALVACMLFGGWMLMPFGPHFETGQPTLVVLVAAQLLRALAGPSALRVTLAGAQRLNAFLCVASLAVLAVANALLIPVYGEVGAGAAVALALAVWLGSLAATLLRLGEGRTDIFALARGGPRPPLPTAELSASRG